MNDRLEAEEQRQSLGCSNEEDTCANNHHDLLLENLLWDCKVLIINTCKSPKTPKETNWKQKFQKNQNENICLTYLNTENKWNFHFLSFDNAIRVMLKVAKLNLIFDSAISFICCDSWRIICEKCILSVGGSYRFKYLMMEHLLMLKMRVLPGKYENFQIILWIYI